MKYIKVAIAWFFIMAAVGGLMRVFPNYDGTVGVTMLGAMWLAWRAIVTTDSRS